MIDAIIQRLGNGFPTLKTVEGAVDLSNLMSSQFAVTFEKRPAAFVMFGGDSAGKNEMATDEVVQTLFYCDPPYWGSEDTYGKAIWTQEDFARLADRLRQVKGRWIVSLNDVPEVRAAFRGCRLVPVKTTYTIAKNSSGAGTARELLIMGGPGQGEAGLGWPSGVNYWRLIHPSAGLLSRPCYEETPGVQLRVSILAKSEVALHPPPSYGGGQGGGEQQSRS